MMITWRKIGCFNETSNFSTFQQLVVKHGLKHPMLLQAIFIEINNYVHPIF
ncbi:hypothetical protein RchiOBHm_Chr5g0026281 [Rosa chinensis]|uniref:Uncharacterized protein n=1 Tax=Rosa chinensis TaxID=74649 RepID=A0A2P6Q8V2_ROSCH|nr:hypothetical protein RchiOBHm_Chr5g0026281 [Rosa chinensis]